MIKRLRIKNFKCWQDTGDIRLAPLTLLFGTNSSGKSSIGQFLLMLKQTAEKGDRKSAFYLGSGGKETSLQLGAFKDIVYHHDTKRQIEFSYAWELPARVSADDTHAAKKYFYDEAVFSAQVAFREKSAIPYVKKMHYELQDGGNPSIDVDLELAAGGDYKLKSEKYRFVRSHGRAWNITNTVRFYGFPDEVNTYYQNSQFVHELNYLQERLFKTVGYLGPMRSRPDRIYSWSGNEPEGVGDAGEHTIPAMLAAADRKLSFRAKEWGRGFQEIIAESLKKLGLIDDFILEPLSKDSRREFEVKVKTCNSRDWVNLPDVGFGISQVLPVLVACFYAPVGSTLLIEEPEIHLYPSAQAALADVFIDVLKARERGHKRNLQLIVETHSEHFLRRLQRRIAEQAISHDDAIAYFVDTQKDPSELKLLEVDMFGNILNWPKDFFGNEMEDIVEQTKAAMKRAQKRNA